MLRYLFNDSLSNISVAAHFHKRGCHEYNWSLGVQLEHHVMDMNINEKLTPTETSEAPHPTWICAINIVFTSSCFPGL